MQEPTEANRDIVIGRNSKIWQELVKNSELRRRFIAIGHGDVSSFVFDPGDRVWILSYSSNEAENRALFTLIGKKAPVNAYYLSTATANVVDRTRCYNYPTVKYEAEQAAIEILGAEIVRLGVTFRNEAELPSGRTMATSYDLLEAFMLSPVKRSRSGAFVRLFVAVDRPFRGFLEKLLYRSYGFAMRASGGWPCLLRPADVLLRGLGYRWYGYVFLSSRLWSSTI